MSSAVMVAIFYYCPEQHQIGKEVSAGQDRLVFFDYAARKLRACAGGYSAKF